MEFDPIKNSILSAQRQIMNDSENITAARKKKDDALFDSAESLQDIRELICAERTERIHAERQAKKAMKTDRIITIAIGLPTLIAAVLFGILGLLR